ncbi:hypothetical protein Nepgr_011157 [Nepenthes gracilis]|uniref:Uncharacterized protein n=1 Tax=Nepenthes gracilis TaxID=150966 RepID=A0AAD3XM43_NEPGR|nr:hypothetical protein Nepgr_011157 [Nepenthes gracilis]
MINKLESRTASIGPSTMNILKADFEIPKERGRVGFDKLARCSLERYMETTISSACDASMNWVGVITIEGNSMEEPLTSWCSPNSLSSPYDNYFPCLPLKAPILKATVPPGPTRPGTHGLKSSNLRRSIIPLSYPFSLCASMRT